MVFDGHSDIFTDVTVRRLKGETQVLKNHHLPRLKQGNIEGSCFVLWIDPPHDANPPKRLGELMQCIRDEMAECEEAVIVTNYKEIEEAKKAGVKHFTYISVLKADKAPKVPMLHAKYLFEEELKTRNWLSLMNCYRWYMIILIKEILGMRL